MKLIFSKWLYLIGGILFLSLILNLLATRIPETAFDSLWYHLTIPKLYLAAGHIYHIPGGLLFYSEMPRLIEFIYAKILFNSSTVSIHIINFVFGIGILACIYGIIKRISSIQTALISMVVFYVTPLVGWLSSSAYIDLPRAFFEVLGFYLFISKRYLLLGLALGLAISTKTLSFGSIFIFLALMIIGRVKPKTIVLSLFLTGLTAIPWFISAYLNTGYLLYPIGAGILDQSHNFGPIWTNFLSDYWRLFISSIDPISPVYVIFVPFFILCWRKFETWEERAVLLYWLFSYTVWFITPRTGGGRFILAYLPVWSILVGLVVTKTKFNYLKTLLLSTIIIIAVVNLSYRTIAVGRSWKVIFGKITNQEYLCNTLPFDTAVFYDCDDWFAKNIKPDDLVLTSGVHNLFYANFRFVDESWFRGERVNYILVQGKNISPYVNSLIINRGGQLLYLNTKTNVRVWKV